MATGRDEGALDRLAAQIAGTRTLAADLTHEGEPERVAAWAGRRRRPGEQRRRGPVRSVLGVGPRKVDDLVRLNLVAPMRLAAAVLPGMVERGRGRVVNVASVAAHVGVRWEAAYSATKWGLAGFSESLRCDLAGTGVGVTLVSPGVVRTAFFERRGPALRSQLPKAGVARARRPRARSGGRAGRRRRLRPGLDARPGPPPGRLAVAVPAARRARRLVTARPRLILAVSLVVSIAAASCGGGGPATRADPERNPGDDGIRGFGLPTRPRAAGRHGS